MSWVNHEKQCEAAAIGQWLLETIGRSMGLATEECVEWRIEKALYKGTQCGAWVKFDEHGVVVGTIVEGSDAEYAERVGFVLEDDASLVSNFWLAVERCERFAEEHFGCEDDPE